MGQKIPVSTPCYSNLYIENKDQNQTLQLKYGTHTHTHKPAHGLGCERNLMMAELWGLAHCIASKGTTHVRAH